jgi:hypothetical protein
MSAAFVCIGLFPGVTWGAEHVLHLRIAARKVQNAPDAIRVMAGDRIELRWTTDEATTVHVHGYDLELRLDPAAERTLRIEATATGRFPISAHGFGAATDKRAQREVVLVYLEVHPR